MLLLYVAVCLLPSTVHSLQCDLCSNDCSEGYMDCSHCTCAPTCDDIKCDAPRECVLESFPCVSGPCPKIPSCVELTKLCQGSPLRFDDNPFLCDKGTLSCPLEYSCTPVPGHSLSVCCKERESRDNDIHLSTPQNPPFNRPPFELGPPNKEDNSDGGCGNCELEPCDFLTCDAYPHAQCVTNDCTCESWFIDQNATLVDCHKAQEEPVVPPVMSVFLDSVTTTTATPLVKSSTPPMDISKVTSQPSNNKSETPKNLESRESDDDVTSDVITHVVIGSCVVFAFIFILLMACRFYLHKKKHKHRHVEEQLKPLKDANGNKPEIA